MSTPDSSIESPELRAGDVLAAKYLLVAPLATGGMGQVWTACNLATGAEVAAKVLLPMHAESPEGLARFRREAQATARLSHRGIVRVFDLIELDPARGSLLIAMELLRGHSLAQHLEHSGPLSVTETLTIVFPLLSALAHAHGRGVVHRDLKPDNVFLALEPDGQRMPKIVDFGISKLLRESRITLDGQIIGTLRYMSPEQMLGTGVDERTDIFSMGILLYECLSGTTPFITPLTQEMPPQRLMSLFTGEPARLPNIPPALWRVIRRALERRPEDRFASAADLAEALRRVAPPGAFDDAPRSSSLPPAPAKALTGPATPRMSRRMAAAAVCASLAIVALASAARTEGLYDRHAAKARAEPDLVQQTKGFHEKHVSTTLDLLESSPLRELEEAVVAVSAAPARAWERPKKLESPFSAVRPSRRDRVLLASRGAGVMHDPGF